jgi:hypothetical protein
VTRLTDLQDAGAGSKMPLRELLRRLKILAARLPLAELGTWVDRELSGYPDAKSLPPYRGPFTASVLGNFKGRFGSSMQNAIIPPIAFPEDMRESSLFKMYFLESIAELEGMPKEKDLGAMWPSDAVVFGRTTSDKQQGWIGRQGSGNRTNTGTSAPCVIGIALVFKVVAANVGDSRVPTTTLGYRGKPSIPVRPFGCSGLHAEPRKAYVQSETCRDRVRKFLCLRRGDICAGFGAVGTRVGGVATAGCLRDGTR